MLLHRWSKHPMAKVKVLQTKQELKANNHSFLWIEF